MVVSDAGACIPERFAILLFLRTRRRRSAPCCARTLATWLPTNPVEPVMKTFILASISQRVPSPLFVRRSFIFRYLQRLFCPEIICFQRFTGATRYSSRSRGESFTFFHIRIPDSRNTKSRRRRAPFLLFITISRNYLQNGEVFRFYMYGLGDFFRLKGLTRFLERPALRSQCSKSKDNRPRKISPGRYLRRSPHRGQVLMIQLVGMVSTGAAMCSPHPLHLITKSWRRSGGP